MRGTCSPNRRTSRQHFCRIPLMFAMCKTSAPPLEITNKKHGGKVIQMKRKTSIRVVNLMGDKSGTGCPVHSVLTPSTCRRDAGQPITSLYHSFTHSHSDTPHPHPHYPCLTSTSCPRGRSRCTGRNPQWQRRRKIAEIGESGSGCRRQSAAPAHRYGHLFHPPAGCR